MPTRKQLHLIREIAAGKIAIADLSRKVEFHEARYASIYEDDLNAAVEAEIRRQLTETQSTPPPAQHPQAGPQRPRLITSPLVAALPACTHPGHAAGERCSFCREAVIR